MGEDLTGLVRGAAAAAQVSLSRPDGTAERLPLAPEGPDGRWTYHGAMTSGLYEAYLPAGPSQKFAVNVNTREGDLTRLDSELLPSQFSREFDSGDSPTSPIVPQAGTSYFRLLLGLLLILLLCEPCLAWYFGRGRG